MGERGTSWSDFEIESYSWARMVAVERSMFMLVSVECALCSLLGEVGLLGGQTERRGGKGQGCTACFCEGLEWRRLLVNVKTGSRTY